MLLDFCTWPVNVHLDVVPSLIVARTFKTRDHTGMWSRHSEKPIPGVSLKPTVSVQTKKSGLTLQETVIPLLPYHELEFNKVGFNPWEAPVSSIDIVTHQLQAWRASVQLRVHQNAAKKEKRWNVYISNASSNSVLICVSVLHHLLRSYTQEDELPLQQYMTHQLYQHNPTSWEHLLYTEE